MVFVGVRRRFCLPRFVLMGPRRSGDEYVMPSSFHIKRFDLGDMDGESSESSDGVGDAEFPRSTTARMATSFDPLLSGASDDFAVAASSDDFEL